MVITVMISWQFTVNLPLLPADTANDAYGGQNRANRTSLGPESSFSLNLYVQSLRPAHRTKALNT
eukprot:COSAG01_NODE_62283_length_285_cov_1.059140_1_plen_64_part_01